MSEVKVSSHRIIGTGFRVLGAYEPSFYSQHTAIQTIDGRVFGQIGTRKLSAELSALPYDRKRFDAVGAWHEAQYQEAYRAIIAKHPEASNGIRSMGQITINQKGAN